MNNTRTIIPCAGYGTRMNMAPEKSKEMLPDPTNGNKPLIDRFIDEAYGFPNPLLIIRKGKADLIKYCEDKDIEHIIIEPTKEWPESVLKSKVFWKMNNILILPDSNLSNGGYYQIQKKMETFSLVFGVHEVEDISKWGEVAIDYTREKPNLERGGWAWGSIGFHKDIGVDLFTAYLEQTPYYYLPDSVGYVILHNFKDRTRNGKVE